MSLIDYCLMIGELLRVIDTKHSKVVNQHYSSHNLTGPSINILLLLHHEGPTRVGDIGARLNMVDSNVSAVCSRLETMDMIERVRTKEDQRVVKIQLTDTAREKMQEILGNVKDFQELFVKNASEDDLKDIVHGLTKLNELLENVLKEKASSRQA
ncbi:MarR family winged helix-turn-helix transcriptional regulator [Paenibacillus elgii]|uniref:MarR family winged helix-turn-helix transcriptional regulator n=1 Tax=Paenibacillus elgii TaxID=189691 RepID=UPI00204223CD|nr:MarR family winged helix-turn-helix transcriptional regulator [Paenibacillus elgii]MCM3269429.1 MarR family winged helix-turn-helix transcriptional regulator [Paenibacillus elgii]